MSIIKMATDTIAKWWKGSARNHRTGHHSQADRERVSLDEETFHPAEASGPDAPRKIPRFEFSGCYHAPGLCLIGVKGIDKGVLG
jgi:hypothetical protein